MEHLDAGELGRAGDIAQLRRCLDEAGYTEEAVCARLALTQLSDFEMEPARRAPLPPPADALDLLVRLFLCGDFVARNALERHLGEHVGAELEALGLLRSGGADQCYATVALYPINGFWYASDRWSWPDGSPFEAPADTVYPALVHNTRVFLDLLPDSPCERCLDVGAGTGIAAFEAARNGARQAWASDIAERCTRFAEFNRRLNGLDQVTAVTSDLYDRLGDLTFDRIVAHVPYMPVLSPKWVFLSGGADGEQITRRMVAGLPQRLAPGGLGCFLTMGSDRRDDAGEIHPFEWRVREWLGEEENEFDVALIVRRTVEPQQFALGSAPFEPRPRAEAHAWRDLFAKLGVTALAYGFLVIQRKAEIGRPVFTLRRTAPPDLERAGWQWLIRWETALASGRHIRHILDAPLYSSRHTEFEVRHGLTQEGWSPRTYHLRTARPFEVNSPAEPWAAQLLAQCDGRSNGQALYEHFRRAGWIPEQATPEEFAAAAAPLVSAGFLEVEGFRPPRAAG
jgi:SAM-dependent methyltransferase